MRYRYQSRKSLGRTTRSSKIIRVIRHYASRKFENSEEKGPGSICFCRAPDFIEPGPLSWAPYLGPLSAPYNLDAILAVGYRVGIGAGTIGNR